MLESKKTLIIILSIAVVVLAIFQDYLFSQIHQTGFYLSESALYNLFWLFFIPFSFLVLQLIRRFNDKNQWKSLHFNLVFGIAISLTHILASSLLFVLLSSLVFAPSHRFIAIFKSMLSNHLLITLVWYSSFPIIYQAYKNVIPNNSSYSEKIKLKIGSTFKNILSSSIQLISTDKPYSAIFTADQKILDSKSLKDFETVLDPSIFIRVHRSAIININCVKEIRSRSNGDYDATLENDQIVRLSRHFRENWSKLLQ